LERKIWLDNTVTTDNDLQKTSFKDWASHGPSRKSRLRPTITKTNVNQRTRLPITIPGRVTPEEQLIVDQISWDITSWYATTKQLFDEKKSAKEEIEKMRKTLTNLKDTRDLTDESVEYAIGRTLCLNGVDRKVYHGQCLIGPQIQRLLANRAGIIDQLETEFL
jgi:hypothetical protein